MDSEKLATIAEEQGLPAFRLRQMREWFFEKHAVGFDEITSLSRDLRNKLSETYQVLTIEPEKVLVSADGRAHKGIFNLHDGRRIESVLLNPKPGLWSTCISSQAGCALKCTFCATGTLGFFRNLTTEEITDQVLFWRQYIRVNDIDARLSNVVYMGMGEPMHNKKGVFASLRELMNPETFGIGARHLSVSTAGLVPAMREFVDNFPQVNLALSLHAANDELRLKLMPINKAYPLEKLADTLRYAMEQTNRKIFIEYIMLEGENDSDKHANELADYLLSIGRPALLHCNLIVYNPTDTPAHHRQATRQRARAFCDVLSARGLPATIRRNLGRDVEGACGQLALKYPDKAPGITIAEKPLETIQ